MRNEIRISGFGGQGVILAGVIIAQATGVYLDMEVAQTQSYGPEARGGACKCDVVASPDRILYPKVQTPSILLAMSQPALDKYIKEADPEKTIVLVDSSLVKQIPEGFKRLIQVEGTNIAEEQLGKRVVANVVMLGALSAAAPEVLPIEALEKAIDDAVNPKFRELNRQAVRAGYAAVAALGSGVSA